MIRFLKIVWHCRRLRNEDSRVRNAAFEALERLSDARAVQPLIDMLGAKCQFACSEAVELLVKLGISAPGAVESLITALRHESLGAVVAAAAALGEIGDVRAVEPLVAALGHECQEAAEALGKLGDPRAVKPLIEALGSERTGVAKEAAKALGKLGDARAVKPLIKALGSNEARIRLEAAEALGKLGDAGEIEPLLRAAVFHKPCQPGEAYLERDQRMDEIVREDATKAVIEIIARSTVEPLIDILVRCGDLRDKAAEVLVKIGNANATGPLIGLLTNSDPGIRSSALNVLGKLGGQPGLGRLEALFRDPDGSVRWQAADALVKLGGQRGLDCLETLLGDPVSGVRWKAADALKSLSWQPVDSEQHANYVVALRQYADAVQDHAAGVKPLIAALRDSGLGDFPKIVEALGKIGVLAVEPLIVALKDQNHPIREGAAAALGKIGDARAVEPLIAALHDKVARVVQHAAQALGRIRDVRAVEPLIVLLGPTFDCDNARNVAEWAASALGKIGDKRAVKPLLRIINENIPGVSDVLLTLGDTSAIKLLIDQIHARTRRGENCSWEVGKLESWIKAFGAIIEPTDLIELSQLKADASFSRKWWTGDGDERSDLIQADGAVLRNLAGEALLKRGMGTGNNIIDCLQCGQKLRIPTGKGMLLVKCPACQSQWEVLS